MSRICAGVPAALLAVALPTLAWAQEPSTPAVTVAPASATAPARTATSAGAPLIVEVVNGVSSRTVKQGDMFPIRLAAPIAVDGRVVVPAGVTGEGQVVDAATAGALGRPAKLVLAARYLTINGQRVPLRGFRLGAAGRDNSDAIMAASFVPYVGMLAMFAKGGEIEVPAGTLGQAKLAADVALPLPSETTPSETTPSAPVAQPSNP